MFDFLLLGRPSQAFSRSLPTQWLVRGVVVFHLSIWLYSIMRLISVIKFASQSDEMRYAQAVKSENYTQLKRRRDIGATKWMKQARRQFIFILDWWSWLHNWWSEAPHDADYDDDILSRVMNRTRDAHRWACNWRAHDIELWSSPTIATSMWEPDERWWKWKRINSRHLNGWNKWVCEGDNRRRGATLWQLREILKHTWEWEVGIWWRSTITIMMMTMSILSLAHSWTLTRCSIRHVGGLT